MGVWIGGDRWIGMDGLEFRKNWEAGLWVTDVILSSGWPVGVSVP